MYKVLIVDDEVLVRVGLKSAIDWESLGFTVVAEASNGEQAYEAYRLHRPEVILTDIKMPKQDGLWLTRKIREDSPQVKILILTCYDDFSSAREALKSGANDYILKSEVEDEELVKVISTVKENLDAELNEQERYNHLKEQMDTNIEALKEKLFDQLLKADTAMDEKMLSQGSDLGFQIHDASFALILLSRDDAERKTDFTEIEWQLMNSAIVNMASGFMKEGKISYLVKAVDNELVFILSAKDLEEGMLRDAAERIRTAVAQYFDIPLSGAVSRVLYSAQDIFSVYQELCLNVGQLFYIDESRIVHAFDIAMQNVNIFELRKGYEQMLINCMDEEEEEKAEDVILKTEAFFRENTAQTMEVKLFYSNMVSNIFERYNHCFRETDEIKEYTYYHNRIMSMTKMKSIIRLVKEIIGTVIGNIKNYRLNNSNYIIKKAIDYIEKNYHQEASLRSLAEYLNLSKHYVCYLFRKETGENISLYVNKVRIEKAKQLVLDPNYKIKEIFDRVGFSDQQYFSKIFKRITGMTVVQYRESVLKR